MPTVTNSADLAFDDLPSVLPSVSNPPLSLPNTPAPSSPSSIPSPCSASPIPLRRSNRISTHPTYLSDYHCSQLTSAPSVSMSGSCRYPLSSVLSYGYAS
ncbi:hypothetical protein QN277_010271 [Acacia crassicarpa]|uniref:Uncharacterized protein n=1 Tax=Acacia crassicarpa TaxID=499986 RepID=A0AAE1INQ4_9FABA|nr:hypothetical protein QN277_010271 [Acacia crassicarpa]